VVGFDMGGVDTLVSTTRKLFSLRKFETKVQLVEHPLGTTFKLSDHIHSNVKVSYCFLWFISVKFPRSPLVRIKYGRFPRVIHHLARRLRLRYKPSPDQINRSQALRMLENTSYF